jgi:hypothetical protein
MCHARTCTALHSEEHAQICKSTKYLMLHLRYGNSLHVIYTLYIYSLYILLIYTLYIWYSLYILLCMLYLLLYIYDILSYTLVFILSTTYHLLNTSCCTSGMFLYMWYTIMYIYTYVCWMILFMLCALLCIHDTLMYMYALIYDTTYNLPPTKYLMLHLR